MLINMPPLRYNCTHVLHLVCWYYLCFQCRVGCYYTLSMGSLCVVVRVMDSVNTGKSDERQCAVVFAPGAVLRHPSHYPLVSWPRSGKCVRFHVNDMADTNKSAKLLLESSASCWVNNKVSPYSDKQTSDIKDLSCLLYKFEVWVYCTSPGCNVLSSAWY